MPYMSKRGNLPFLLTDRLRGQYCTIFVKAGGCVVASMKNLRLQKLGDLWSVCWRCGQKVCSLEASCAQLDGDLARNMVSDSHN